MHQAKSVLRLLSTQTDFDEHYTRHALTRALNITLDNRDVKFLTVFKVYFKRAANREWQGVANVVDQDGQQVLEKHGSFYIQVHPCGLQLCQKKAEKEPSETTFVADKNNPYSAIPESDEDDTASNIRKIGETNKSQETFETDIPSEPL